MNKVNPCIWCVDEAEDAANFYVGIVPDSEILRVVRSPVDTPGGKAGRVLLVVFRVGGQVMTALNGGMQVDRSMTISLELHCDSQAEIDRYWAALGEGGTPLQCGWMKDKYGIHWQIFPDRLIELIRDPDTDRAAKAMHAMMEMVKIDLAAIEAAVA